MAATQSSLSSVDCNAAFEALDNVYRRRLLVLLLDPSRADDGISIPEGVHTGRKALAVLQAEMFHKHIPKLTEFGFVGWDQDTDRVVRGPAFDEIRPLLELLDAHQDELPPGWID